jgi:hypothetical protein
MKPIIEPFSKRFPDTNGIKPKTDRPPAGWPKRDVLKLAVLILLLFSTSVFANENTGSVYFGKNLAKPLDEHTDKLYLKIDNSEKLYFNRKHDGPVLENLDLNKDHAVNVYFDDKVVQSWILNYSKLNTHAVLIWRSAGSWRMEVLENSKQGGRTGNGTYWLLP